MSASVKEIAEEIFRTKRAGRWHAARLPIEEKLRVLVRLQEHASLIRHATGQPEKWVWRLD